MLDAANLGLFTAFVGGLISFLSPCVLPLVPGYVSFVAGHSVDELRQQSRARWVGVAASLAFIAGFATVFILMGLSATALGRLLLAYRQETNIVGGIIVIVFGLFMSGLLPLRWLHMDTRLVHRLESGGGPLAAYLLGLAFAFGWSPCIGPVLGAILTVSATGELSGASLLAAYSVGLGVPFLLTALFVDRFLAHQQRLRRWSRPVHLIAGILMIIMGIAMVTGQLTVFAYWLLEAFPVLGRLG